MNLLKYHYEKAKYCVYGKNKFIVVSGNPVDGYKFIGPFDHFEDALNKKGQGYIAELSKGYDDDC